MQEVYKVGGYHLDDSFLLQKGPLILTQHGTWQPIVVSFKKGENKFSDQCNSQIKFARLADRLPAFAHTYLFEAEERNMARLLSTGPFRRQDLNHRFWLYQRLPGSYQLSNILHF
jgi:hypothetical protein